MLAKPPHSTVPQKSLLRTFAKSYEYIVVGKAQSVHIRFLPVLCAISDLNLSEVRIIQAI
jgi:hypothetical protein